MRAHWRVANWDWEQSEYHATRPEFPLFDNRDSDTTWIWFDEETCIEVDREFADALLRSFVENAVPEDNA
jgi:hypothetical protein